MRKRRAIPDAGEYRQLLEPRLRQLVRVDQPVVLITQIARAGGTLLMRLLDGHPQCHALPHELGSRLAPQEKLLAGCLEAWEALEDDRLRGWLEEGFRQPRRSLHGDRGSYPLLVPLGLQRAIFLACCGKRPRSQRGVLDAYWTSYFNAWLDNRHLRDGEKRWVTAFEPNIVAKTGTMQRFAELYPDGRIVSLVRDPASWWASARRWSKERFGELVPAIAAWAMAAEAVCTLKEERGEAIRLVRFDDLVAGPEATMSALAAWLEIAFTPSLLQPTFNGLPIAANSSFGGGHAGISHEPLSRRDELTADEVATIDRATADLYERLVALAVQPA